MKQFLIYFGATISFGMLIVAAVMVFFGNRAAEPIEWPVNEITNTETATEPILPADKEKTISQQIAPLDSAVDGEPPELMKSVQKVTDLASITLPVLNNVSGPSTRNMLNRLNDRQIVKWFSDSGRVLIVSLSTTRPSKIAIIDVKTRKQIWSIETKNQLRAAAVSHNGSLVAIAELAAKITCYDAASGKVTFEIAGPPNAGGAETVRGLRFDETGQRIISAHFDRTVRTWDTASQDELSRTSIGEAHTRMLAFSGTFSRTWNKGKMQWWATDVSPAKLVFERDQPGRLAELSPDGKLIATIETGGSNVAILNVEDGSVRQTLTVPPLPVAEQESRAVRGLPMRAPQVLGGSFSADGRRFAAFTSPSRTIVWDTESGDIVRNESMDRQLIVSSRFSQRLSPNGEHCLLPTQDGGFEILEVNSDAEPTPLTEGAPMVDTLASQSTAFSDDGMAQAVALVGGAIEIRDTVEGRVMWSTELLTDVTRPIEDPFLSYSTSDISAFAVSNGGTFIIVTTHSGDLIVVSRGQKPITTKLAPELKDPLTVTLSPDERYAIIPTLGGGIVRVDLVSALQSQTIKAETLVNIDDASLCCSAVAIDSTSHMVALGHADGTVQFHSLTTFAKEAIFTGADGPIRAIAFSTDGQRLACTTYRGTAVLWNTSIQASPLASFPWPDKPEYISTSNTIEFQRRYRPRIPLRFSADGKRLFVGCYNTINVLDADTGKSIDQLKISESPDNLVQRNVDDRWLASRCFGEVYEWAPTVTESLIVQSSSACRFVQFTPDGSLLISGGENSDLNFIDAGTGNTVYTGKTETGGALRGRVSPDGTKLAVCGHATGIEVWDIPSRQSLGKYYGHKKRVHSIAFSPDSTRVASGSADGTVRIREVETKKQIRSFGDHLLPPTTLAFSHDGQKLLTGTSNWVEMDKNGVLRVWDVETGKLKRSLDQPFGQIGGIGLSPFDQSFTISVANEAITLRNAESCAMTNQITVSTGVKFPRYLLHGRLLAFVEYPSTIHLRDLLTGDEFTTFNTQSMVFDLATLPRGNAIAAACEDGTVHVWRLGE